MFSENIATNKEIIENLELSDLINIPDVQFMMNNFFRFSHIPMAILDLTGNVLVAVGWQEICMNFHRVHPETSQNCLISDLKLTQGIPKGEFKLYKCKNGMWDMATPIYIGDQQMGNLFMGQFFFKDETINHDDFRMQAAKYNFDASAYLESLKKVPVISKQDLECAQGFLIRLTDSLSQLSYSNIRLTRSLLSRDRLAHSMLKSENRFFTILESVGEGVIATDAEGKILYINPVAEALTGWDSAEVFKKYLGEQFSFINKETGELINPVGHSLKRGKRLEIEKDIALIRRDGSEILTSYCCAPIRDKESSIIGVVVIFRDITERIRTEKLLEERTARLEKSQEIAHLGSWELDIINDRLKWSDEAYRIFGLPRGTETTYKAFLEVVHPGDRDMVNNAYSGSILDNLKSYEIEHRIIRKKTGEVRFVHEKCEHFRDETGRIVRSVGMVHDITDRKKTEIDLVESRRKLDLALTNSKIGVWEWDLRTGNMTWDERMEKIFGLDPGTFGGTYQAFENFIHEEDLPHLESEIYKALSGGTKFEIICRTKQGEGLCNYISSRGLVIRNENDHPVKVYGVSLDVTHMNF